MLSWSEVIDFAKAEVGFPHHFIEFNDNEIRQYLEKRSIRKFSQYFPDKWQMAMDTAIPNTKFPGREDMFIVNDDEGREIISLDQFIPTGGDHFMQGHPYMGAWSFNEVPARALETYQANNLRPFGNFNYTIQFYPPNKVRITPKFSGQCTFEYSRMHAKDLSSIAPDLADYFKEMCTAMFMMWLGSVRKNYTEVNTPFGQIPLNADDLYSRGETKYNEIIEKFESSSAPFIILDIG